ncbi:ABC transporter ATP-binding protein [Acinetobacter rathckeae]|uniref:ABC transporter ATP-binding protein n=1 Tax=Acinetobacter rathckeae TaxID=2605272 RepID=UPI0018A2F97F|nr:ABC transporter ATP-binding protein [Acinetobacter rathckeae]MBF7688946.1 ABC transporter ATP-binding protein [Acinetobacter rathckeae]MBF7696345.1 ABC transporter ATP-binding protein [Acinetobacter rathckeae]
MTNIFIRELSFQYQNRQILEHINLQFHAERFSVLLGKNGSGKSTLFNLMAGIYPLQQGQILFETQPLQTLKGQQRAKQFGFLAQNHHSVFNFQVLDVVMTGRSAFSGYRPSSTDQDQAFDALKSLDIAHLAQRDYTTLSGGERQLVMIARILTQNPKVIFLDEPTNHLDMYYQAFLMEKLQQLSQQGYTIVAIMHDPNLAFLYADDFFFLKQQQIIKADSKDQASCPIHLQQIYGLAFEQGFVAGEPMVMPKKKSL